MTDEEAMAINREFGYIPNEKDGERWIVYKDQVLIVTQHERRPRLYERGCHGRYVELEPLLDRDWWI